MLVVAHDCRHYQVGEHRNGSVGHGAGHHLGDERVIHRRRSVLQSGVGGPEANVGYHPEEVVVVSPNGYEGPDFDLLH